LARLPDADTLTASLSSANRKINLAFFPKKHKLTKDKTEKNSGFPKNKVHNE
jgi:hypothetical protein